MAAEPIVTPIPRPNPDAEPSAAETAMASAAGRLGPISAETVAASPSASVAARLKAGYAKLQNRTKRFAIPPADVWGDDLVLVAKPCEFDEGMAPERFILDSTSSILARNPDTGQLETVEGGWLGVARLMEIEVSEEVTLGQIVKAVINTDELLAGFVERLIAFTFGTNSQMEKFLGE